MVVLRCTRDVLARVSPRAVEPDTTSTTRLGDWYVALVRAGHLQLLLAISERTRLPVVIPARNAKGMATPMAEALRRVLLAIGIPEADAEAECAEMADAVFAPTRSRSLLGTVSDFAFSIQYRLQDEPETTFEALALWLSETPIVKPFDGDSPFDLTRRIFGLETQRRGAPPVLGDPLVEPERPSATRRSRRAVRPGDPVPMDLALFTELSTLQRYEYLEGALHGSPAPDAAHQHAVLRVARALEDYFAARDPEAVVLVGPVTLFLDDGSVAQPDVVVVSRRQLSVQGIAGTPQLIVEIVTAESARRDRDVKVRVYGAAGVERYWLIDGEQQMVQCLGRRGVPGGPGASVSGNVLQVDDLPGFALPLDTLWLRNRRPH